MPRAPRRDDEVDSVRTIFWFHCLGDRLGKHEARAVQRAVAPNTIGVDSHGDPIKNGKFLAYKRGARTPSDRLVEQIEQQVPRSARSLNHPLWQVLRTSKSIKTSACQWVRQLDPEIQRFALSNGEVSMSWGRHTLEPLERRASLDSLAALTIMMRLHHEQGNQLATWDCAQAVFRVLLILGPMFEEHAIAEQIFKIYVSRVFSLVVLPGRRIALEDYDYPTRSGFLNLLADELRAQSEPQAARRLPTFYALQVLDGKQQRARLLFTLPVIEVA
nr:hypothetical protein [Pseudomonas aeruginosa]